MQITIQKVYLIAVEVSENVFRVFLLIVRYVFNVASDIIDSAAGVVGNAFASAQNFLNSIFGFNLYKINNEVSLIYIEKSDFINSTDNDRLIFSNLLAPPAKI